MTADSKSFEYRKFQNEFHERVEAALFCPFAERIAFYWFVANCDLKED